MAEIPILLLAAGSSTRMGQPKQLLSWGNVTLIEHQIQTLLKIETPVSVVLGANAHLIVPILDKFKITIVLNKNWENGMGSSIAAGINRLTKEFPKADGVLITLLDQPLVTIDHLKKILQTFQSGKQQIIVSQSASGWRGVPVLFDKFYFKELETLNGKEGAKTIIQQHKNAVTDIECGEILEDMDTPDIYQCMLEKLTGKI